MTRQCPYCSEHTHTELQTTNFDCFFTLFIGPTFMPRIYVRKHYSWIVFANVNTHTHINSHKSHALPTEMRIKSWWQKIVNEHAKFTVKHLGLLRNRKVHQISIMKITYTLELKHKKHTPNIEEFQKLESIWNFFSFRFGILFILNFECFLIESSLWVNNSNDEH